MNTRLITVGHSPDPDNAFMFYALAHDKLDTGGLRFSMRCRTSKRSIAGHCVANWKSLPSAFMRMPSCSIIMCCCRAGAAWVTVMGQWSWHGSRWTSSTRSARIAVPGTLTTAFLTLRLLLPGEFTYEVMPFDQIIAAVAEGRCDAGLIIHEGQLTFQNQGLQLVVDLGVWWQERTGLPLPLGGDVVRRDLGMDMIRQISRLFKESIHYALTHRDAALDYALHYARDMNKSLADRFVGMYVNDWTIDYGPREKSSATAA